MPVWMRYGKSWQWPDFTARSYRILVNFLLKFGLLNEFRKKLANIWPRQKYLMYQPVPKIGVRRN